MSEKTGSSRKKEFLEESQQKRANLVMEFLGFLRHNKKWWLLPIIFILLVLGLIIMLSGTAIAPFLYPLF